MKTLTTMLIGTTAPTTAFAAANATSGEDGLFVWIFLGFFAMIVIGQLIPAIMLIVGFVKGITTRDEKKVN